MPLLDPNKRTSVSFKDTRSDALKDLPKGGTGVVGGTQVDGTTTVDPATALRTDLRTDLQRDKKTDALPAADVGDQTNAQVLGADKASVRGAFGRFFALFGGSGTAGTPRTPGATPKAPAKTPTVDDVPPKPPVVTQATVTKPPPASTTATSSITTSSTARRDPLDVTLGKDVPPSKDLGTKLDASPGIAQPKVTTTTTAPVTKPTKPTIDQLYNDPQFKALYDFVMTTETRVGNEHREWDKLGQVKSFAAAVDFAIKGKPLPGADATSTSTSLFQKFPGVQERRAVCHLLMLLMPQEDKTERPMLPDGSRGAAQELFRPFPDAVIARANDDFALKAGDLPKINPIFTQHLSSPTFLDDVFKPGQRGLFLASKKFCPGAFVQDRKDKNPPTLDKKLQSGHEGDPIMVKIDDIVVKDGVKYAKVHVPEQHKVWLGDNGGCSVGDTVLPQIDVVTGLDGKPVLDKDGKPQPILVPVDHLAQYMLSEGYGSRGLDLQNSAEDRAIALTFSQTLKETWFTDKNGIGKTLFQWLEQADQRTPPDDVARMREQVRVAAFQTVARYTCHPRRTHFKVELDANELAEVKAGKKPLESSSWQVQAYVALDATGIMRDQGNHYEKDKASTADVHEMAWTSQFLKNGFIGGSLDCIGSADAYDKLCKTFLEPLGVVSMTSIAEGHGAALVRTLGQQDDNGVIQAGVPMKVKLNEFIVGLDMPLSSGRGPAAQYMENWGGYLKIAGPQGRAVDFAASQQRLSDVLAQVAA